MLLSKINANMIIQCDEMITPEQVVELQKFKEDPYRFDSTKSDYSKLVDVTFTDYDIDASTVKEGKLPEVKFTNAEQGILG